MRADGKRSGEKPSIAEEGFSFLHKRRPAPLQAGRVRLKRPSIHGKLVLEAMKGRPALKVRTAKEKRGKQNMMYASREDIIRMTPQWKGERMADGRPKVPQDVLERMRRLTMEEVWGYAWSQGYEYQVVTDLKYTADPSQRLVGRAVTCTCVPFRQDLHEVCSELFKEAGYNLVSRGGYNKALVQTLVEDDVIVIDFFDKVRYGTFVGGNLSTAIKSKTKRGGAVIWGGLRDLDQIKHIDGLQLYYRGVDPTPIRDYVMTATNMPTRIGPAVCLPGDIVFGAAGGIVFVPAHLAEITVVTAEKSQVRDIFGFERLADGTYTTQEIDVSPWPQHVWDDFMAWFKSSPKAESYRHLDFSDDIAKAQEILAKRAAGIEEEGKTRSTV